MQLQRERDTVEIIRLVVTEPSVEIALPPLDFMIYSHKTALFSFFVASMGFPIIILIFVLKCDLKEKERLNVDASWPLCSVHGVELGESPGGPGF